MITFINETSFPANLQTEEEVVSTLETLVRMAPYAQTISGKNVIRRHRDLHNQEILPTITLREYIARLRTHKNRKFADRSEAFLRMFSRGPFVEPKHTQEGDYVNDIKGQCRKGSCLDDASSYDFGAALISFINEREPEERVVAISSKYGTKTIPNFSSVEKIQSFCWVYEPNPKHELKADKNVNGVVHSAMPLSKELAQRVLTNGVKIGKSVFGVHQNQWFKFHCHEGNRYHGFPVEDRRQLSDLGLAQKILGAAEPNSQGQVLGDDNW